MTLQNGRAGPTRGHKDIAEDGGSRVDEGEEDEDGNHEKTKYDD